MAKLNGTRGEGSEDGNTRPVKRGPPPLPVAPKLPKKSAKRKVAKRDSSDTVKWSLIGGGAILVLALAVFIAFQLGSASKVEPANSTSSETASTTNSTEQQSSTEPSPDVSASGNDTADASVPAESTIASIETAVEELIASATEPSMAEETTPASEPPSASEENVDSQTEPVTAEDVAQVEPTSADGPVSELDMAIQGAARLMVAKEPKDAIATLVRASKRYKTEIRPDFYLGLLYSGVGANDAKNAEIHFRNVIERSPGHVPAANNLALTFIKSRKFRPVWTYFTMASKDQRPPEVDQNLGRLLSQAAALGLQKEELKLIQSLNVNSNFYQSKKGWIYMPLDNSAKSLAEFQQFCRNGNLEDKGCLFCNGEGKIKCRTCAGRKGVVVAGSSSQQMRTVLNPNDPITTTTATSNVNACPTCRGSGKVDCGQCQNGQDPSLR